ncbi:hypothetical protein GCM10009746_01440 [Microbacterium paludicola]
MGIERAGLDARRGLDQQRHDPEPADRQGQVVIAGEHDIAAVEVGHVDGHAGAGERQALEGARRRTEVPRLPSAPTARSTPRRLRRVHRFGALRVLSAPHFGALRTALAPGI